jgi:hypothetical protein
MAKKKNGSIPKADSNKPQSPAVLVVLSEIPQPPTLRAGANV